MQILESPRFVFCFIRVNRISKNWWCLTAYVRLMTQDARTTQNGDFESWVQKFHRKKKTLTQPVFTYAIRKQAASSVRWYVNTRRKNTVFYQKIASWVLENELFTSPEYLTTGLNMQHPFCNWYFCDLSSTSTGLNMVKHFSVTVLPTAWGFFTWFSSLP